MVYLFLLIALLVGYFLGMLTMACLVMAHQESEREKHEIEKGDYDGGQMS